MADNSISGRYRILPSYPVRPPRPPQKEREQHERQRERPRPVHESDDDVTDPPTIDEYV